MPERVCEVPFAHGDITLVISISPTNLDDAPIDNEALVLDTIFSCGLDAVHKKLIPVLRTLIETIDQEGESETATTMKLEILDTTLLLNVGCSLPDHELDERFLHAVMMDAVASHIAKDAADIFSQSLMKSTGTTTGYDALLVQKIRDRLEESLGGLFGSGFGGGPGFDFFGGGHDPTREH